VASPTTSGAEPSAAWTEEHFEVLRALAAKRMKEHLAQGKNGSLTVTAHGGRSGPV
jgi:hypothetical protein